MEQSWMDGNVVGGVLSEVFTADMTAASGRCRVRAVGGAG